MEPILYLEYPVRLKHLFSPVEIHFILYLELIELKKAQGEWVPFGKNAYLEFTGLTEYAFDACIKRMEEIGLIIKTNNQKGNRVYYNFQSEQYERLKDILERFPDDVSTKSFCSIHFVRRKEKISEVTDYQIREHIS